MLASEGLRLCFAAAGVALALTGFGLLFGLLNAIPFMLLGLFILGFTLWFFRDPARTPPAESEELLIAPADGKVMFVKRVHEPDLINGEGQQVSIFLSPLNVHVNRVPATGTIAFTRYIPGEYLVAWHEKSSELNERSEIGMHHSSGLPVIFKQIAGAVARRIVFHIKEGEDVAAGQRYGIVKFGSRMDVIVPLSVDISVQAGDRVVAGESILGSFPSSDIIPGDPSKAR